MSTHDVTEPPRHSVSVAAAIFDEAGENVLLIKRSDNGRWEPPGGVLELDETIEDGLRREVREETGAEIEVGPLTGVYKNMSRGIVALVFRCTLRSSPAPSSPEAAIVSWTPVWDMDEIAEAYRVRITDATRGSGPAVRHHDAMHLISSPAPIATEGSGREPNGRD